MLTVVDSKATFVVGCILSTFSKIAGVIQVDSAISLYQRAQQQK